MHTEMTSSRTSSRNTPHYHQMTTRSKKKLEEEQASDYSPSQDSDTESDSCSDNESVVSDDSLVEIFPQFRKTDEEDDEDEEEDELDLHQIHEPELFGDLRKRVINILRIEIKKGLNNIAMVDGPEYRKALCVVFFDYLHLHLAKLRLLGRRFAKEVEAKLVELEEDQPHDKKFVRRIHFYQESMANWFHWADVEDE